MLFFVIAGALILGLFGAGAVVAGNETASRGLTTLGLVLIWLAIGVGYPAGSWS